MSKTWKKCLETLKGTVPVGQFSVWIKPLKAQEKNGTLTILAPNDSAVSYLKKNLPVFTSADDNMASNERFIQISETDTETFIQSMKNDNNPRCPVKMFKNWPGYHPETPILGRGMITRPIWKCQCIKLFITYFRHLEKRHPYWPETTYIRRQPSDSLKPDSKFYLSVLPRYHDNNSTFDEENSIIWYSMQPIEKKNILNIVIVIA
jgi:chromosomal replication initiation ATPase DnaA